MHRRRLTTALSLGRVAVASTLAALAGCKTAPYVNAHIETLNAEYRQLEDYVYSLEDDNARLQHELDALRAGGRTPAPDQPRSPRTSPLRRPATQSVPDSSLDLEPPSIEVPGTPSETPPTRRNRPEIDVPPESEELVPPRIDVPDPPAAPEPIPATRPADTKVSHLFLNPVLTGGADLDGDRGDDGLAVAIEPRNAADEYVPAAGPVSIVVLDPSRVGEAARVARWDFDLAAAQQKLDSSKAARGIAWQLPWPTAAPAADKLHLFVRYETADGRRVQTDREIFIAQPGQVSQRWTPRQPGREPLPVAKAAPPAPPAPMATAASAPAWSPFR
jgi:hypothetical protein